LTLRRSKAPKLMSSMLFGILLLALLRKIKIGLVINY
jgi:hypothetical protein